ncbi:penicillin acylase family protein, partial [Acinetobacter baumannii]
MYAKPALVPKVPKDVDTAYLNNFSAGSTATSPIVPQKGNGSNNWAVAGTKTKSGKPILCNDPHLGLNLPS